MIKTGNEITTNWLPILKTAQRACEACGRVVQSTRVAEPTRYRVVVLTLSLPPRCATDRVTHSYRQRMLGCGFDYRSNSTMIANPPIHEAKSARSHLLDARPIADQIKTEVRQAVIELAKQEITPCLAAVRVGDDEASAVYVRNKMRACEEVGIRSEHHALPASTTASELLELIGSLNRREDVDGFLVQLPLPREIDETKIIEAVDPEKDVDGFHPVNVGKLLIGERDGFAPCTPSGVQELLVRSGVDTRGMECVVIGRSNIVGKPMAALLMQDRAGANATVTVCHHLTRSVAAHSRRADARA